MSLNNLHVLSEGFTTRLKAPEQASMCPHVPLHNHLLSSGGDKKIYIKKKIIIEGAIT